MGSLPEQKRCPHCGRVLPSSGFYIARGGLGLSGWCRDCVRVSNRMRDRRGVSQSRYISHGRYVQPPRRK